MALGSHVVKGSKGESMARAEGRSEMPTCLCGAARGEAPAHLRVGGRAQPMLVWPVASISAAPSPLKFRQP